MFLLLTFPLADQIETCVMIWKLVSLRFRYFVLPPTFKWTDLHSQNIKYLH
jgi:hypothetical protein